MKKVAAKITYESFYAVWRIISEITDIIYEFVCFVDKWLADHGE